MKKIRRLDELVQSPLKGRTGNEKAIIHQNHDIRSGTIGSRFRTGLL